MGSKGDTCNECSRNCLMIHRKRDPSQHVSSFFKVMFGKNFSEFLILPPRFVKFNSLMNRETYLEDSTGRKWNVVLSTIDDYLAFKKGWRKFVLDHDIDVGDFVVFHYITRSHFMVQVYGRSGCEKHTFSSVNKHMNKRAKTIAPVVHTKKRARTIDRAVHINKRVKTSDPVVHTPKVPSTRKNDTEMSEVTPRTSQEFPEDSSFMFSRDTSSTHEGDRAHLFDLSTYERLDVGCPKNGAQKNHSTEANTIDHSKPIRHLKKESSSSLPFTGYPSVNDNELLSRDLPEMPSGTLHQCGVTSASGRAIKNSNKQLHRSQVAETSVNVSGYEAKPTIIQPEINMNIRKVDGNYNHMKDENEVRKIVKQEPADIYDDSPLLAVKVTCLVKPDSECFLELPDKLPIKEPKQGIKGGTKLVLLRDQVGRRLWPVKYHQKNGLFVLTNGWETFRKTHNIQPGDECTFMVASVNDSVFDVQILRR